MDNITHTLVGLTAAEATFQFGNWVKRRTGATDFVSKPALMTLSVLANNLPDADILYHPGPLGYLLYHRGYTHTLLGILPQWFLLVFLYCLIVRMLGNWPTLRQFFIASSITLLGLGLHLFADSWNSYGIHPYWPFDNHWRYGDFMFIVEPWLWVTLLTILIWAARSKFAKTIYSLLLLGALSFVMLSKAVAWQMIVMMSLWSIVLHVWTLRTPKSRRLIFGLCVFALFVGFMFATSRHVRRQISDLAWQKNPEAKFRDLILSPFPGNFFCWSFISLESYGEPATFRLRSGLFSLDFVRFPPNECNRLRTDEVKYEIDRDPRIVWADSVTGSIDQLRTLRTQDCRVEGFLRFARAPYFKIKKGTVSMADLRFDRTGHGNFSELEIEMDKMTKECDWPMPPWIEPRAKLLGVEP